MDNCKFLIQSLNREDRKKYINQNKSLFPDLEIFNSVNGYNIEETINELIKLNVELNWIQFETYGTLANWITKMKAFEYQVNNSIEYMCLIEDDLLLKPNFKDFVYSLLPKLNDNINMIRLCNWGEGYITHIEGAKRIINHLRKNGIIHNIDNQLRDNCGNELYVNNTPFELQIGSNHGDCLKTSSFDLKSLKNILYDKKI